MTNQHSVLVLNCGSSSLKFAFFPAGSSESTIEGIAEELGTQHARLKSKSADGKNVVETPDADHAVSLSNILQLLPAQPDVIGHRVVHGGETFRAPALITAEVIEQITACIPLAPLHNPAGLLGIKTILKLYPELPQVAVFDTAFHQTLPEKAFRYAVPTSLYKEHGVRRYGFHGTSHDYVSKKAAEQLGFDLANSKIINAHLGNGASATAILNGKSVDTTMGLTPLEGLVMGTRSGDVDPGLLDFLSNSLGYSAEKISKLLNKESGMLALSEVSSDMRRIEDLALEGEPKAVLANEIYAYRLSKSLAALAVGTGGCETLIFTGGVGENSPIIRESVLKQLSFLGVEIDTERNNANGKNSNGVITKEGSKIVAAVIPTNEELMIATLSRETAHA